MERKLKKGMIIIDAIDQCQRKILSKPYSGELPDHLVKLLGVKTHTNYRNYLLCTVTKNDTAHSKPSDTFLRVFGDLTYNNKPCMLINVSVVKPSKEK